MVKAALKKELAMVAPGAGDPSSRGESNIRLGYQRLGGDFLVAVRYAEQEVGGTNTSRRHVLGGIGVRKWTAPGTTIDQQQPSSSVSARPTYTTYEIHRFFVAQEHRGQGLGKALLQMAESVVAAKVTRKKPRQYRIVATTLALLEEANRVYTKQGYYLLEETSIGELRMKTYAKDFGYS